MHEISPERDQKHNQNFLQYWDKEIKEEILPLEGPIGEVLEDFKHISQEYSESDYDQYDEEKDLYPSGEEQFDSLLDYTEKNFADVIKECQIKRHASCLDNRLEYAQVPDQDANPGKEEILELSVQASPERLRRREAKQSHKRSKSRRNRYKHAARKVIRVHNSSSPKVAKVEKNSGLIIKIRSSNNVNKGN